MFLLKKKLCSYCLAFYFRHWLVCVGLCGSSLPPYGNIRTVPCANSGFSTVCGNCLVNMTTQ